MEVVDLTLDDDSEEGPRKRRRTSHSALELSDDSLVGVEVRDRSSGRSRRDPPQRDGRTSGGATRGAGSGSSGSESGSDSGGISSFQGHGSRGGNHSKGGPRTVGNPGGGSESGGPGTRDGATVGAGRGANNGESDGLVGKPGCSTGGGGGSAGGACGGTGGGGALQPGVGEQAGSSSDDDVEMVGEVGQVATRDMPHSRGDCAVHRFKIPAAADSGNPANGPHCGQCFCYVCDMKASECKYWGTGACRQDHANARPAPYWDGLRRAFRAGQQEVVGGEFRSPRPLGTPLLTPPLRRSLPAAPPVMAHTPVPPRLLPGGTTASSARSSGLHAQRGRTMLPHRSSLDGSALFGTGPGPGVRVPPGCHLRPACPRFCFAARMTAASNRYYCAQCVCVKCGCAAAQCRSWGSGTSITDHANLVLACASVPAPAAPAPGAPPGLRAHRSLAFTPDTAAAAAAAAPPQPAGDGAVRAAGAAASLAAAVTAALSAPPAPLGPEGDAFMAMMAAAFAAIDTGVPLSLFTTGAPRGPGAPPAGSGGGGTGNRGDEGSGAQSAREQPRDGRSHGTGLAAAAAASSGGARRRPAPVAAAALSGEGPRLRDAAVEDSDGSAALEAPGPAAAPSGELPSSSGEAGVTSTRAAAGAGGFAGMAAPVAASGAVVTMAGAAGRSALAAEVRAGGPAVGSAGEGHGSLAATAVAGKASVEEGVAGSGGADVGTGVRVEVHVGVPGGPHADTLLSHTATLPCGATAALRIPMGDTRAQDTTTAVEGGIQSRSPRNHLAHMQEQSQLPDQEQEPPSVQEQPQPQAGEHARQEAGALEQAHVQLRQRAQEQAEALVQEEGGAREQVRVQQELEPQVQEQAAPLAVARAPVQTEAPAPAERHEEQPLGPRSSRLRVKLRRLSSTQPEPQRLEPPQQHHQASAATRPLLRAPASPPSRPRIQPHVVGPPHPRHLVTAQPQIPAEPQLRVRRPPHACQATPPPVLPSLAATVPLPLSAHPRCRSTPPAAAVPALQVSQAHAAAAHVVVEHAPLAPGAGGLPEQCAPPAEVAPLAGVDVAAELGVVHVAACGVAQTGVGGSLGGSGGAMVAAQPAAAADTAEQPRPAGRRLRLKLSRAVSAQLPQLSQVTEVERMATQEQR